MRIRSTGLGATELVCQIDVIKTKGGYLLVEMDTVEPVKWRVRVVMTYRDIFRVIRVGIFSIFAYFFIGLKTIFVTPPPPVEY